MTKDKSKMINSYLTMYGNTVRIVQSDGEETFARALIQNAWTRQHLRYDLHAAKPGRYGSRYWLYIGPPSLNILALNEDATLHYDNEKYCFVQREAVTINNTVQYYRGILKKAEEENDVFIS